MANTGFISMAPAIAAVAAQITTVDGIVDDILVDTGTTLNGIVEGILNDTDVIIPTAIGILGDQHAALAEEHVVIDGIVDDILVDTDATIPAAIAAKSSRGNLIYFPGYDGVPGDTDYHEALNLTNKHGKLVRIQCYCATTNASLRITIDGNENITSIGFGSTFDMDYEAGSFGTFHFVTAAKQGNLNIEFGTTLKLEIKQSNGANVMRCIGLYILDA